MAPRPNPVSDALQGVSRRPVAGHPTGAAGTGHAGYIAGHRMQEHGASLRERLERLERENAALLQEAEGLREAANDRSGSGGAEAGELRAELESRLAEARARDAEIARLSRLAAEAEATGQDFRLLDPALVSDPLPAPRSPGRQAMAGEGIARCVPDRGGVGKVGV